MPFGLSTAPSTFQRFLDWVLKPMAHLVIAYVDDILVYANSLSELKRKTARVKKLLLNHQVMVNEKKSAYNERELDYVGLRISEIGIGSALPQRDLPSPRTVSDWQSLLGYANCFRDYLPLSELTAGLYPGSNQLPEPARTLKMRALWNALSSACTLTHYDDNAPGELYLDASKYALGAVLTQQGKVCAVYSKGLSKSQQNYSATDREHLALMHGLESFRIFVHSNSRIGVHSDHSALLNRNEAKMTPRQLRWKQRITAVTTKLAHVKGNENPADFWSRRGWEWGGDNMFSGI